MCSQSKPPVTDEAQRLIDSIVKAEAKGDDAALGVSNWLLGLAEQNPAMIEDLAGGVSADSLKETLHRQVSDGDVGRPMGKEMLITQALEYARGRGAERVAEVDVTCAVLAAAGFLLVGDFGPGGASEPSSTPVSQPPTRGASELPADATPGATPGSVAGEAPAAASAPYRPRATRGTPTLDEMGWDLTRAAVEGKLTPVVGRENEIQLIIETLCRRTKRNPVLVGPAGVGKTAIVEGLAQLIARNEVPAVLQGTRLISLSVSSLVAKAGVVGQLEERMKTVLSEAGQDGIVLFIDEAHSIVGAGASAVHTAGDISNQLKPALARGDIACIAATTDDEYRRFIERDSALERRFQPVRVQELTAEQSLHVLHVLRDDLQRDRGVMVPDEVLVWLVDFADQFLKNRFFPDKAVDALEQCVAHCIARGSDVIDQSDAEAVAQRMVGMPIAISDRLGRMTESLRGNALLLDEDIGTLADRLEVTMRGFDFRQERPNAVVLLTGDTASRARTIAETIAQSLYGAPERVVDMDFGRFVHESDVNMLVGAPPGYIGYSDSLPLHRLAQMPWCVLLCENVQASHPKVRDVLTQALDQGFIVESRGKKVYLSDAVVFLTAHVRVEGRRALGFDSQTGAASGTGVRQDAQRTDLEARLGPELMAQVDLVCSLVPTSGDAQMRWLEQHLLATLGERCRKRGVEVDFDQSFVAWLLDQRKSVTSGRDWERLIDEHVSPLLIPHLENPGKGHKRLAVRWEAGAIRVDVT